jgi:hypothetical protein
VPGKDAVSSNKGVAVSGIGGLLLIMLFVITNLLLYYTNDVRKLFAGLSILVTVYKHLIIVLAFTAFILAIAYTLVKSRRRRKICARAISSSITRPRYIVSEARRLGLAIKAVSRRGKVTYTATREGALIIFNTEYNKESISNLLTIYGRGIVVTLDLCREHQLPKCKKMYFSNLNEVIQTCRQERKVIILFKKYNINVRGIVVEVSDIIELGKKLDILYRLLEKVQISEGEVCIVIVDPVEYIENLPEIIRDIVKIFKNKGVKVVECVIAINSVEKNI